MAWYGVDETWELCCNKGCLTKYQKHEVSMPDGRKKDVWLCPGCKHQDVHVLGRYINLREKVDYVHGMSSTIEAIKKDIRQAGMTSNISAQSNEVRLKELEKRLRRIEELITFKKPTVKKVSKKKKKGIIRTLSAKVKSVIKRLRL